MIRAPQRGRHDPVHDHRGQVVASAGSTIFDTATVTGNIKNMGVSSTDTELTTVKPDGRSHDHEGRPAGPGLRALMAGPDRPARGCSGRRPVWAA